MWQPALDRRFHSRRQQARPRKRWIDDITSYLTTNISNTQQDQHYTTTTITPTPRDDDNSNLDVDDDDDGAEAHDEDDGTDQGLKEVEHATAPVCWISEAQNKQKWKSLEEGFVKRS